MLSHDKKEEGWSSIEKHSSKSLKIKKIYRRSSDQKEKVPELSLIITSQPFTIQKESTHFCISFSLLHFEFALVLSELTSNIVWVRLI